MSGIFGFFCRDGSAVSQSVIETMYHGMADWGRDGIKHWHEDSVCLGQALSITTQEARFECQPYMDVDCGSAFTVAARVDNRNELARLLNIPFADLPKISDGTLIRHAYSKWGEQSLSHIYGDWAFAVWTPAERRLFLARDHSGNTSLYYHADQRVFAFASSRQSLLDLKLSAIELDELYLAQVLTSWMAYHGERTIHSPIRRLPPGHTLTVTPDKVVIHQYWHPEDTVPLILTKRADYVSAFREVFDDAVCARLRRPDADGDRNLLAATLSGGLDSSSIVAIAAEFLRTEGARLAAYTSVPLSDTVSYVGDRFGNEFSLADATARFAGNVDLYPIYAAGITPIQAIRRMLQIAHEPAHAAGNFYWLQDLVQTAHDQGCKVLLTGQGGNHSISWEGDVFSQSLGFQLKQLGWRKWFKETIKRSIPPRFIVNRHLRRQQPLEWCRTSAINPDFASRLRLMEQLMDDPDRIRSRSPLEQRHYINPTRTIVGGLHAQRGAAYGIEVRDPTADARVIEFTLSIPDHIFMDPTTGMDRWLIREAMQSRLPDEVRLNRKRGRQAGDLVPRLRASADEVESVLDELGCGPAASYVDIAYMRQVWRMIQSDDSPGAYIKASAVLTRGIMAGLFVNQFNK